MLDRRNMPLRYVYFKPDIFISGTVLVDFDSKQMRSPEGMFYIAKKTNIFYLNSSINI